MPVKRTPDVESEILQRLSQGETLRAICRDDHMPDESSVRGWVLDDPAFAPQYARARNLGLDSRADRIAEIASDRERDPNCRRIEIEAEKWALSKMRPDLYGDKLATTLSGPDGGPVQISDVNIRFVRAHNGQQVD